MLIVIGNTPFIFSVCTRYALPTTTRIILYLLYINKGTVFKEFTIGNSF